MFRFLKNFSLRSKLFALTVSLLLVAVGVGYFGQTTAGKINAVVIAMQNKQGIVDSMAGLSGRALALSSDLWTEYEKVAGRAAMKGDVIANLSREREEIGKGLASAESLQGLVGKDKDDVRDTHNKWNDLQGAFSKLTSELARTGNRSSLEGQMVTVAGTIKQLAGQMNMIRTNVFDSTLEQVVEAAEASAKNRNILMGAGPLFVVFALVAFIFTQSVVSSLNRVGQTLLGSATEIQGTSQQISVIGHALSEITSEQSAAVEETVASMEEMSSMMSLTSNNAQSAMRSAEETQGKADEGVKTIDRLKDSMEEINHANEKLEEINRVIEEINEKTKIINDIVAETRMLSFNASIEAARAGEHGRGFAVVAEQIGNLAKMSGKAAQEIRMLIAKSTSQVNSSINFTQDKVKAGQSISEECAAAFGKITENIRHLSPIVNAIGTAAGQQETGIAQTNKAMQQMDVITNKNLKRASEAASAGKRLEDQYGLLADAIGSLNQIIFGGAEGAAVMDRNLGSRSGGNRSGGSSGGAAGGAAGGGDDSGVAGGAAKLVGKLAKVTKLLPKDSKKDAGSQPSLKKAAGDSGAYDLPSPDDSRFET